MAYIDLAKTRDQNSQAAGRVRFFRSTVHNELADVM